MPAIRQFIQKNKGRQALCLCLLPFAAAGLLLLLKNLYEALIMPYIPPCIFRSLTGWRCPSCGMTHAVFALSRLDFITAIRENFMIPLAVLFILLWYMEQWFSVCGSNRRLLPRRGVFWIGVLIFWLIYTILRNILPGI